MIMLAYTQFIEPAPGSMAPAGWSMGFVAYAMVLIGGVLMSLTRSPKNLYGRYWMGVASVPLSLGLVMLI